MGWLAGGGKWLGTVAEWVCDLAGDWSGVMYDVWVGRWRRVAGDCSQVFAYWRVGGESYWCVVHCVTREVLIRVSAGRQGWAS